MTFINISKDLKVLIDGLVNNLKEYCGNFPLFECDKKNNNWAYKFAFLYSSWMFNSLWKFGLTFNISEIFNIPVDRSVNNHAAFNECCGNFLLFEHEQEQQDKIDVTL